VTTEESFDFAGKLKLPLPDKYDGNPSMWEEWSWNFKTYISMFDSTVKTLIDDVEGRDRPLLDADLTITLDTGDVDPQAALQAVNFSRKLHYFLANLTTGSARLIVRQNEGANGFETWRRMNEKIALPDATRHVSLLTQLLDFLSSNQQLLKKILIRGRQSSQSMKLSLERTFLIAYLLPLC
jgi:hypothetical protein